MLAVMVPFLVQISMESTYSGIFPYDDDILNFIFDNINLSVPVIISVVVTVLIIFVILRKEWIREKFWSFKKIGKSGILPLFLCVGLGAAMNILTLCVINLLPVNQEPSAIDDMLGNNFALEFLAIALLGPIIEEIIFRGIVQKRLSKMMRVGFVVIIQAMIFGLIHMDFVQSVYAGILGIFIGLIYLWFDSIWHAITVHAVFNATSVILMHFAGDAEVNLLHLLIISGVAFIASMASLTVLAVRRRKDPRYYNRWAY